MDKNVGSVDLSELLQARQELNSQRGIETDPDMYKNYNPNRKNEEQQTASTDSDEESFAEQPEEKSTFEGLEEFNTAIDEIKADEENEISLDLEGYSSDSNVSETSSETESSDEVDFSVYDNFAAFDVIGDTQSSSEESEPETTQQEEPKEEAEEPISASIDLSELENDSEQEESQEDNNSSVSDMLSEYENSLEENSSNDKTEEDTSEDDVSDLLNALNLGEEETVSNESEVSENSDSVQENNETETNFDAEIDSILELDGGEDVVGEEETSNSVEEPQVEDDGLEADKVEDTIPQNAEEIQGDSVQEKLTENLAKSEIDSEEKIKNVLAGLGAKKAQQTSETANEQKQTLPLISDVDFIDMIGSREYENIDKLTYTFGKKEDGKFEFSNIKDLYNVAVFSESEDNIFKFFSSMMLSIMLKSTIDDVKFALLDSKHNSMFDKFSSSSYLFGNLSKSNDDMISLLSSVIEEIEDRYESIASSGTKNIEEYNKAMAESRIIELPYIVVLFNGYTRAASLDDSNKISDLLMYILKYGRLVGVYAYVSGNQEIEDENINFNLATRISFKTNDASGSMKFIGESGAEQIAGEDEFVLKTIYLDELEHFKVPNITAREVELLIENIEG